MSQDATTREAIALLLDLAAKGEIDPWNVDVIAVIDRFLAHLEYREDLQASGQALLYGAMLVQLKAKTLDQAVALLTEPEPATADQTTSLPTHLERVLQRRPTHPPPPTRPVTLSELIAQIEEIAQLVAQKTSKPNPSPLRQSKAARRTAMQAIAQLAHKENLTETVIALEAYLGRQPEQVIDFTTIVHALGDQVGVFWGLLLLSAQNKVELWQTEFYGKIYLKVTTNREKNSTIVDYSPVWQEVS
ncbi:MAG: segregation/condensation protein A [Pseudanabaenaceae cyanobacterium]